MSAIIYKHYLYRHIRLDKNEVFYIGIGTKRKNRNFSCEKHEYQRAFSCRGRNMLWQKIVKLSDYKVEIILESNDYTFIKEKEIEFIELYGRKDLKTGALCNLTNGGDGTNNLIVSEDTRKLYSLINKGKKRTLSAIELSAQARRKKIYQYDLQGNFIKEWNSIREAANYNDKDEKNISSCALGKSKQALGFQWKSDFLGDKIYPYIKSKPVPRNKKVMQKNLKGEIITIFNSIKEASFITDTSEYSIGKCCNYKQKTANNFIWEFLK